MKSISENATAASNTATNSISKNYTDKLARNATVLSTLYMLPMAAQAGVVYVTSPLSISIDDARAFDYQPVDWDVDGNSVADFRLEAFRTITYIGSSSYSSSIPFGELQLNSAGLGGQGMVQNVGDSPSAIQDLSLGSNIGSTLDSGRQWGSQADRQIMSSSNYFGFATGNLFTDGQLIGFNFLGDGGQTLYGWAQVSVDELALSMTIDRWAYEDNGGSIQVGQISSVPLPPSALLMLSGLALGAGGVLRGRKVRKAEQEQNTKNF